MTQHRPMHATKSEVNEAMALANAPARLNVHQAAAFLGFEPHEIHILAGAGVLKALGRDLRNAPRFFALVTLERLRQDELWLATATDAIRAHWRRLNRRKRDRGRVGPLDE